MAVNLSARETVQVIREEFPGYDKSLNSKVNHPEKYGVRLLERAEQLLAAHCGEMPRKRDGHKLTCRVSARMSKTRYRALQRAIKADGYETMQGFLQDLIGGYLERR